MVKGQRVKLVLIEITSEDDTHENLVVVVSHIAIWRGFGNFEEGRLQFGGR
jgi:hypothetical protein